MYVHSHNVRSVRGKYFSNVALVHLIFSTVLSQWRVLGNTCINCVNAEEREGRLGEKIMTRRTNIRNVKDMRQKNVK